VRRLGLSLVLLSAALMLLPSGPQAQVVVDPDSPAGKEYAIPLEEKRDQANGNQDSQPGDGQASTFGEGISDPSKADGKGSADGTDSKQKKKDAKKDSGSDSDSYDSTGAVGGSGSGGGGGGPDEAGTSGALLTSGIALAVLLLGGGIAFLMRRGAFGTDA
jgi:hypothetical protein